MSNEIVLFDLPCKGRKACWSLNPWKTRLALNFKGLSYKTEWTEYPDLKPKLQSLGVPPNPPGSGYAEYSSPTIRMPDGSYVMESRNIADALEKLQPEPSMHLDSRYIDRTQSAVQRTWMALNAICMPRVPERLLNPASQSYFLETRAKRVGMPLHEFAKSDRAGENAWRAAEPSLMDLKEILQEHPEGPYVMGKTPSYVDFIIAGFCDCARKLDQDGDLFPRLLKFHDSLGKHYEACKRWLEKDD